MQPRKQCAFQVAMTIHLTFILCVFVISIQWLSFKIYPCSFQAFLSSLSLCLFLSYFLLRVPCRTSSFIFVCAGYGNICSVHSSKALGGRSGWCSLSLSLIYRRMQRVAELGDKQRCLCLPTCTPEHTYKTLHVIKGVCLCSALSVSLPRDKETIWSHVREMSISRAERS